MLGDRGTCCFGRGFAVAEADTHHLGIAEPLIEIPLGLINSRAVQGESGEFRIEFFLSAIQPDAQQGQGCMLGFEFRGALRECF